MPRIQTVVRIRPLFQQEQEIAQSVTMNGKEIHTVNGEQDKTFTFDQVFESGTNQASLYRALGIESQIQQFFNGFSQTIFAYGQTGSGKTYTMDGTATDPGIIPQLIAALFSELTRLGDRDHHYELSVSFLQIYNEKVFDMLNFNKDNRPLRLRFRQDEFQVENLIHHSCSDAKQLLQCYQNGCRNKIRASHLLNESSSRSHCIFTIKLQKTHLQTNETVLSSFHLVDLAGSERAAQTNAQGQQLIECAEINKSLFTLRQVISQMAKKSHHVPYRDSKLTSILKNSLQGKSYVTMIVCISTAAEHLQQTLQSLTYGAKARTIQIEPKICKDVKSQQMESLRAQVTKLTQQLQQAYQQIETQAKIIDQLRKSGEDPSKLQPVRVNNFLMTEQPKPMTDQLRSQNNYIQTLLATDRKLQADLLECKASLGACTMEITSLSDENQHLRDRIQIFEDIIYQDLQNSKESDTFQKDWRELFENEKTQSSLLNTITDLILKYKRIIQDQQRKLNTKERDLSVNRSMDTTVYSKQTVASKRMSAYQSFPRPKRANTFDKKI